MLRFNGVRNKEGTYALIDSKGNIVEKFRVYDTALMWKGKLEKEYFDKLEIVNLLSFKKDLLSPKKDKLKTKHL